MSGSAVPPIEVGSLTTLSPNESQFIGSSSGIFFVNTVRRAFATSKIRTPGEEPQPENDTAAEIYIGGVEIDDDQQNEASSSYPQNEPLAAHQDTPLCSVDTHLLGQHPNQDHASKLVQVYFRVWHPLFPFLHGPTFVKEVEAYYSESQSVRPVKDRREHRYRQCRNITFQCVFNIAALDRPDLRMPIESTIKSVNALTTQLCSLATRHDIPVLQALLAGQIYLIATMSLHAASMVGGVIFRLIFHGGLHRCPCRFSQISSQDAEIRKRIFWSAYAADRHLSQALGIPLGIQDSDVDVCIPGLAELHRPVQSQQGIEEHLPEGHPALTQARSTESVTPSERSRLPNPTPTFTQPSEAIPHREKRHGEDALAHYVAYGRLTGRALEMLHKSLNVRVFQYSSVLELTSEVHSFWNSLPQHLQDLPNPRQVSGTDQSLLGIFFTLIYQQLILLVNRPFLSLQPTSLEFRLSLQTCITSSRTVISTLKNQASGRQFVSWPGTLSVTWMSGLILAFACGLDMYPAEKGFPEIKSCLDLLKEKSGSSRTAKHCHLALKSLLDDLSSSQYGENLNQFTTSLPQSNKRGGSSTHTHLNQDVNENSSKRQRLEIIENETSDTQPQDKSRSPTKDTAGLESNSNFSSHLDDVSQLLDAPFGSNLLWNEQPAYTNDMFSQLSCENLLQYDGDFGEDFWNSNPFP